MANIKEMFSVSQERIQRFIEINEAVRESSAYAETALFCRFGDLSLMQMNAIRTIGYYQPCTMSQIAKSTHLTRGSVTQLTDKLIDKGYVRRQRSQQDRRIVYAQLTAKGREVIAATEEAVSIFAKNVLGKFNHEEQELILKIFKRFAE